MRQNFGRRGWADNIRAGRGNGWRWSQQRKKNETKRRMCGRHFVQTLGVWRTEDLTFSHRFPERKKKNSDRANFSKISKSQQQQKKLSEQRARSIHNQCRRKRKDWKQTCTHNWLILAPSSQSPNYKKSSLYWERKEVRRRREWKRKR